MGGEIIPDDKNWTWVLERRCDDCGFDAPSFDARGTGGAVRDLNVRWAVVLGREHVRERPQPGVWSPLEYGCHVRDVFLRFDARLALMLGEIDPHFENWDQDATALQQRYDLQDPAVVARELARAGNSLAARFDTVQGEQWSRRGFRSDGSAFTVESIARYLMHDPVHHLWDVGAEVPTYGGR
ncbi:MAG: DinB family protein [Acidimicrobiales bacterium]